MRILLYILSSLYLLMAMHAFAAEPFKPLQSQPALQSMTSGQAILSNAVDDVMTDDEIEPASTLSIIEVAEVDEDFLILTQFSPPTPHSSHPAPPHPPFAFVLRFTDSLDRPPQTALSFVL